MEEITDFTQFEYGLEGLHDSISTRATSRSLTRYSRNLIPEAMGLMRPFRGMTAIGQGARRMCPAGERWAGLDDVGATKGAGTIFSWIADMLMFCGFGQVVYDGANISGVFASSLLKILLRWGGSYTDAKSGPFVAGTPQPSSPTVGLIDTTIGGIPTTNGTHSFKVAWIKVTGGRSIASDTSVTLSVKGKAVYLVFADAPVGAEIGVIFVTKQDFGGKGLHYRLVAANPYTGLEYTVNDIERQLTDVAVTNASKIINSPLALFTQGDVGKLFRPVSAGFSVPAGTIIEKVISPTQAELSNNVTVASGVNPRSADVVSYAGGFERGVLLNWKESDLADEIAWSEDYPPEPASAVFPLEKVIGLITDADSLNSASADNRGTVAQFSLRNQPESYSPLHKLYLPSPVIDVLWRGKDSYVFVGCKTFVGAFLYIDALDEAPVTLTTILADEGILSPNNWCVRGDGLYLITAKGVPTRIVENGAVDTTFGDKVRRIMNSWTMREKIIVASYPDQKSVSYSYGNITLLFNTELQIWSAKIQLKDAVANIEIISGLGVSGRLLLTGVDKTNPSSPRTLYDFDSGSNSVITAIPHYSDAPNPKQTKCIQQISVEYHADRTDKPVYLSLHLNEELCAVDDAGMTSGDNLFTTNQITFDSSFLGKYVAVVGAGNSILRGRIIQIVGAHSVRLGTPTRKLSSSVALNATNTVAEAFAVIAHRIYQINPKRKGVNRPQPLNPFINGARSFALGITMETNGEDAMPLNATIAGTVNPETNWKE